MSANIREAVDKLSAAIAADPAKARARNTPATARLKDGLQCEITGPHGDTATVVAMRAAKLGIELTSLEVHVESESDNRGMLGLDPVGGCAFAGGLHGARRAGVGARYRGGLRIPYRVRNQGLRGEALASWRGLPFALALALGFGAAARTSMVTFWPTTAPLGFRRFMSSSETR